MNDPDTPQKTLVALCFIGGLLALFAWWVIYALRYYKNNVAELIARSGWKHQLVKRGTVERRFSSNTDGISWTMEFKVLESKRDSAQLDLPSILEWHTSDVKLAGGTVVIITIPPMDREAIEYAYQYMLGNLDIWLSSDLSPQQIGSIEFQSRYTVMADTKEAAQQVLSAAEHPLLQWPEWKRPDLNFIPTPVLIADANGISVRISVNGLGLQSHVYKKIDKPFLRRVFGIVQLGVKTATGLRNSG